VTYWKFSFISVDWKPVLSYVWPSFCLADTKYTSERGIVVVFYSRQHDSRLLQKKTQ